MSALTERPDAAIPNSVDQQPAVVEAPRVVATASHYHELLQAIRDRVAELEISHETLDALSGIPRADTPVSCSEQPTYKKDGAFHAVHYPSNARYEVAGRRGSGSASASAIEAGQAASPTAGHARWKPVSQS